MSARTLNSNHLFVFSIQLEQERIQANLKKQGELLQAEADSTGVEETQNGSTIDDADLPEEVRKARKAASKLAEGMVSLIRT
jgi:hypothetical protein